MQKQNRPAKKLTLDPERFNTLYSTLLYFIGMKYTFGENEYNTEAVKLKVQIDHYGRFIECENPDKSQFIIYYFDKEVMSIMNLLILHNTMNLTSADDFFTQLAHRKKSKKQ